MANLLTILGHPNPQSLCGAMATAYADSAAQAGAEVRRIQLAQLDFDPVLRAGYAGDQPLEPDLQRASEDILWADHVTFLFPTWWSSTPALLKGFIDRVMLPGFAYRYPDGGGLPEKLLTGRSARVVSTMDSPRYWNLLGQRRALHHAFARSTLGFVGFSPVRERTLYGVRERSRDQIERFIARVAEDAIDDLRRVGAARNGVASRHTRPPRGSKAQHA